MRSEKEMYHIILETAKKDDRIRAVFLNGSRANKNVPTDIYQDYDIVYVVTELESFKRDPEWIDSFGERLILQTPETMRSPSGLGHFNWMMLFSDGNRLDLTLIPIPLLESFSKDSLTVPLLDKDDLLPAFPPASDKDYLITPPTKIEFESCCNNFWWCLQNVAKGIARDQLPYALMMYNTVVRKELHDMIDWFIGIKNSFSVSSGKMGKYYKRFLPKDLYEQYCATYSNTETENIWCATFVACELFHTLAVFTANHFDYSYQQEDENGIREYLIKTQNNDYQKNLLLVYKPKKNGLI